MWFSLPNCILSMWDIYKCFKTYGTFCINLSTFQMVVIFELLSVFSNETPPHCNMHWDLSNKLKINWFKGDLIPQFAFLTLEFPSSSQFPKWKFNLGVMGVFSFNSYIFPLDVGMCLHTFVCIPCIGLLFGPILLV
jgi:hypothetical protein